MQETLVCDPKHHDEELWNAVNRLSGVVAQQHEMLEAAGLLDNMLHGLAYTKDKVMSIASKTDALMHKEVPTDGLLHNSTYYFEPACISLIQNAKIDGKPSLADAQDTQRAASIALATAAATLDQAHKTAEREDKARNKRTLMSPEDLQALNSRATHLLELDKALGAAKARMEEAKALVRERVAAVKVFIKASPYTKNPKP